MRNNHREIMAELAVQHGWKRGIELGLGSGHLFERFLSLGIEMIGVDIGNRPDRKARCSEVLGRLGMNSEIHWCSTDEAHPRIEDGWADFIFIDAAHSYEAVRRDIRNYLPKVKPDGWFGGHDYHPAFPGVVRAVDEACRNRLGLLEGHIWMRKPA